MSLQVDPRMKRHQTNGAGISGLRYKRLRLQASEACLKILQVERQMFGSVVDGVVTECNN